MLCSKSFNKATSNACEYLVRLTRRLCTEFIDPLSLAPFVHCRQIPLDTNSGVRPIGIGDGIRRIIGKSIILLISPEIIQAVGSLQLSTGKEGGCEAACHAMREIFNEDECQGVLSVDAFNSLTRKTSLLNMMYLSTEFQSTSLTLIDNQPSCSCQMVLISVIRRDYTR